MLAWYAARAWRQRPRPYELPCAVKEVAGWGIGVLCRCWLPIPPYSLSIRRRTARRRMFHLLIVGWFVLLFGVLCTLSSMRLFSTAGELLGRRHAGVF